MAAAIVFREVMLARARAGAWRWEESSDSRYLVVALTRERGGRRGCHRFSASAPGRKKLLFIVMGKSEGGKD